MANELYLLEFLASAGIWTALVEDDRLVVATGRDLAFDRFALSALAAQPRHAPALSFPDL